MTKKRKLKSPSNEGRARPGIHAEHSGAGVLGNRRVLSDKHSSLHSKHRRNDGSHASAYGQKGSRRIFNLEGKSKAGSSEICADF